MSDDLVVRLEDHGPSLIHAKHASAWVTECGQMMLEAAAEITRLRAALSTRAGERERVIEEVLALVDDFKPPQPEASEFAKGADFTARQLWAAIRALASPTTVGGGGK